LHYPDQTWESEPKRNVLLLQLYEDLMSKTLLPTLRDAKTFAQDNGLSVIKVTSREKAIVALVKAFLLLSPASVENYFIKIQPVTSKDDRSLEGWSNIILNLRNDFD
jgi:hypothetical protein